VRIVRAIILALALVPLSVRAQDAGPDGSVSPDAGQQDAPDDDGQASEPASAAADAGTETIAEPPPEDLPSDPRYEVVVVGRRPTSRDRTHDASQVDGQQLRDSPRASTLEAISQQAADVYVPGRGAMHGVASGASGGIHIRGLGGSPNSQVLVVEDGVPDYQGIFGHPIPDAYVPFLIDDVLVVKGGDSVLYGTNAMGGVVVIRSRWLEREGYEVSNDAACGSYSTLRETASVLGRFGSWDVAGAFHALSTDGHRQGAGGNELIGTTAARYRFTPELRLTLRNKVIHLEGADPGTATHPFTDHWYDVWRDNASLQLTWSHDVVRLNVTPYFNVGVHRLYDGFHSTDYVGGGSADLELRLHRTTELLLGVAGQHVGGEVENRITGERPDVRGLTDVSFYTQLTFRPVDRLALTFGTREIHSTSFGFDFFYKGGVRWSIVDGLYVRTRVARNFRQPTIREMYLPFPTANPDLRPEYSLSWDFGAGYVSEHLEVSCSGYRTEAEDLIRYFGAWPTAEVVNIDHVVVWGVEGMIGVRNLGPVSMFLTGNWQDVGRYTRQNPNAKINFTVDAGQEFGAHLIGGSVSGEWVHGLYMADYARQPIDDLFVMDLTLRYRYSSADRGLTLEPYVVLRNLLDRRYAHVEGYPMPGFNFLLGLKVGI
jgi:outer membrane receptor protein involved in Fe transport